MSYSVSIFYRVGATRLETYNESSKPILSIVGLFLVERHIDEIAIGLGSRREGESMLLHVAKVLLRIRSGRRSQSLKRNYVSRNLVSGDERLTLKYLIFHPRPSSFSSFQTSYSGMVKNEISFFAFVTCKQKVNDDSSERDARRLTLTIGVMNSRRKLGTLRSEGKK